MSLHVIIGQVGLDPGAAGGSAAVFWFLAALSLAAAIASVFMGVRVLSQYPRVRRIFSHPVMICAIFCAIGISLWWYMTPSILVWDLARNRNIAAIGWPESPSGDTYIVEGRALVTLKLPGNRSYNGQSTQIYADRQGKLLTQVQVAELPGTVSQINERMQTLTRQIGFTDSNVEAWEARRQRGDTSGCSATIRDTKLGYEIRADVHPSFDDARPWYIMFSISWAEDHTSGTAPK